MEKPIIPSESEIGDQTDTSERTSDTSNEKLPEEKTCSEETNIAPEPKNLESPKKISMEYRDLDADEIEYLRGKFKKEIDKAIELIKFTDDTNNPKEKRETVFLQAFEIVLKLQAEEEKGAPMDDETKIAINECALKLKGKMQRCYIKKNSV